MTGDERPAAGPVEHDSSDEHGQEHAGGVGHSLMMHDRARDRAVRRCRRLCALDAERLWGAALSERGVG